jgi:hypothetical protein
MKYAVICFRQDKAGRILTYESMELSVAACDGIDLCDDDIHFGVIYDIEARAVCSPTPEEWDDDDAMRDICSAADAAIVDMLVNMIAPVQ